MKTIDIKTIIESEIPQKILCSKETEDIYLQFRVTENAVYKNVIKKWNQQEGIFVYVTDGENAVLSPSGRWLAFSRRQEAENAIFLLNTRTGGIKRITSCVRPDDMQWSADEKKLLFTCACFQKRQPEDVPVLETARWMDRLKFKTDRLGYSDGTFRQIGLYDLVKKELEIITAGRIDYTCPCFVGKEKIAYVAVPNKSDNSDEAFLFIYNMVKKEEKKYRGPGGPIHHLLAVPEKNMIFVLAHDNHLWEATNFSLFQFNMKDELWEALLKREDLYLGNCVDNDTGYDNQEYSLLWDAEKEEIIFPIVTNYKVKLAKFLLKEKKLETIYEEQDVVFLTGMCKEGILMLSSAEDCLARLNLLMENQKICIWESNLNSRRYKFSTSESFEYLDAQNKKRVGHYFHTENPPKGLVLLIHGGPHYCFGYDFSFDIQFLTENNYNVVLCNPTGSIGYGELHAKGTYHDWGGKDYIEIMNCIKTAREKFAMGKYPVSVMGGSYGGFMTNWIIGHTDFFCCAISERSTCNRYSQAGTSDCAFRYGMFEFNGTAWEHPLHYMEHSPISYVKNVNTPVLLLHGDADMNCSIEQSEEWFSALRMEGKEAYLAIFPKEFHDYKAIGSPASRRDRYRLILWWLDKYMMEGGRKYA
ncbi:prolyl oligopeptidase family serine peptidase [Kineothrix sp. MSJ-39]|uniref:S9 family peptidase n=1 Tax=Kineothrix sp. MSJ-39 TaxID=2841533 RepID=UPI001C11CA84|nr:prolyl oligopeptidase family serine peptidase [Kineothrix sp. MSJ-39]MBU5430127.1 prolyl oligopeptidase family serine peptidase [Kineothrix sp. MSJ-39]